MKVKLLKRLKRLANENVRVFGYFENTYVVKVWNFDDGKAYTTDYGWYAPPTKIFGINESGERLDGSNRVPYFNDIETAIEFCDKLRDAYILNKVFELRHKYKKRDKHYLKYDRLKTIYY